jgi:hypothetical protein
MYEPSNRRFRCIAQSTEGVDLWTFLQEENNLIRLQTAADLGHPAVEGVDRPLTDTPLGQKMKGSSADAHALRQLAGMMTREIMERLGYRLGPNKRTRKGYVFSRGATYFKGASIQEHVCGQIFVLHHEPMGNGQVLIYFTPLDSSDQKLSIVDICPSCGERYDSRTLTDIEDKEHE